MSLSRLADSLPVKDRPTLIGYSVVGCVGFFVDASLLSLLVLWLSADILIARCVSFATATIITWLLNRTIVFTRTRQTLPGRAEEYGRYLLVQIAGALTNLLVFFLLIDLWPMLARNPILPLAGGAAVSMAITFGGTKRFVFV